MVNNMLDIKELSSGFDTNTNTSFGGGQEGGQQTLISRTQKQHTTQQVKTFENWS